MQIGNVSRKSKYAAAMQLSTARWLGRFMSGEKKDPALGSIEKKIDKIADELASVKKDLSVLSSVKGIDKKVESLEKDLKDAQSQVTPISDLVKSLEAMD